MSNEERLTMTIHGAEVPVTVQGDAASYVDRGTFRAEVDGAVYSSRTWNGLYEILTELAAGDVAVPFTLVRNYPGSDGSYLQNGTARAHHKSSYRTVLVTWPGGQKASIAGETTVRQLPDVVAAELDQMLRDRDELTRQIKAILAEYYQELPTAVDAAMASRVTP